MVSSLQKVKHSEKLKIKKICLNWPRLCLPIDKLLSKAFGIGLLPQFVTHYLVGVEGVNGKLHEHRACWKHQTLTSGSERHRPQSYMGKTLLKWKRNK